MKTLAPISAQTDTDPQTRLAHPGRLRRARHRKELRHNGQKSA